MRLRIIHIGLLLILFTSGIQAQQDAQFTQYMYNTLSVNPAYAGTRGVFGAMLLHRSQWVGLEGAPETQTLNVQSPVGKNVGLGLSIINDNIGNGTVKETSFDASASYTIQASEEGKLSFGIKAGGHLLGVNTTKLKGYEVESAQNPIDVDNKFSPNFGAGIYYHTEKFYFGLSIPNMLETKYYDTSSGGSNNVATERISYYMIVGQVFDLSYNLKLKPAILLKATGGAPLQADISANFLYNERLTLGAAYRWDAAVSALMGFQINHQLMVGLAYDRETTELGNSRFNDGSFEVFVRFELFERFRTFKSPRFF